MYNNDVVADLECRFAEGEVVTWEEFYKWIDDILDGFDTHDHSGVSGGGPVLNITDLTGYAALAARVTALEGAGYATQTYVDNAVAGLASVAWVASTFYNQTYIDGLETYLIGQININSTDILAAEGDIDACESRLDTIESTYATKAYADGLDFDLRLWVLGKAYATQLWVATYYYDSADIDTLEAYLQGQITTNASGISGNANDIDACEARLTTIETTYATESWVSAQGYATTNWVNTNFYTATEVNTIRGLLQDDIDANASDIDWCEWDIADNASAISALDGRVTSIEGNYATETYAFNIAESQASDHVIEHEGWCINYDH